MKLSRKIFIITFALSVLPLFFVALHTTEETLVILKEREVKSAETNARGAINEFTNDINRLKNLVRILAATRAAKLLPTLEIGDSGESLRLEIIELFKTVLRQNPSFGQVRLIGLPNNGLEVVRVDRTADGIKATPRTKLQTKGYRYYFLQTIGLSQGETFLSHIDLNREFGKIELPPRPVIRVATPVTNEQGENVGIIIINVNFHELVTNHVRPETPGDFLVTNATGDYLHHVDTAKTFAFEFGRKERIQTDYGIETEWAQWVSNTSGVESKRFETPDHFLILSKVDIGFGAVHGVDRKWVYGFAIPRTAIESIAARLDEHLYISLFAIAAFIAIASSYITSSVLKPLEDLTKTANQIAQGDPDVTIDATGKGEVRVLSDALQRMLASLKEAAKTQELATMGRMAAMLAHDLRNSLSTVKMNVQILQTEREDDSLNDQWEIANDQIQIMENVLADMLAYARPEILKKDWHDPTAIAKTACLVLEAHAHVKSVSIQLSHEKRLPRVFCDRTKVMQALQNLLDNALHFSPEDSEISVNVDLTQDGENNFVTFEIADQGPGIDDGLKDTLFDPFITNRPKGTGLGLAIVKKIVDQHEGLIDVNHAKEKGASFALSLPLSINEQDYEI